MNLRLIYLVLCPVLIFLQNEKPSIALDHISYHISVHVSSFNLTKAVPSADALYTNLETENERLETVMLTADMFYKQEDHDEAIQLKSNKNLIHNSQ